MADVKDLKIKTGVLKRAMKEHSMYEKEVKDLKEKLASMDASHDRFGQTMQTLEESKAMLLDSVNRIPDAKESLELIVNQYDKELAKEANELIQQAEEFCS